jgi:Phage tail assembly chaperone proteins, E, or 41 or 14
MTDEATTEVQSADTDPDHITVTLSTPINAYGEDVSVIKMRKPTGADLLRVGNPVEFDPISDPPKISHNMQRVQQMVARLANIPSSSLEKMATQDWVACAWAVTPFFLPKAGQT